MSYIMICNGPAILLAPSSLDRAHPCALTAHVNALKHERARMRGPMSMMAME
jgi:hypothetical protein